MCSLYYTAQQVGHLLAGLKVMVTIKYHHMMLVLKFILQNVSTVSLLSHEKILVSFGVVNIDIYPTHIFLITY